MRKAYRRPRELRWAANGDLGETKPFWLGVSWWLRVVKCCDGVCCPCKCRCHVEVDEVRRRCERLV